MVTIKTRRTIFNECNNDESVNCPFWDEKWALIEEQKIIFDKFWLDNCELTPKFSIPLKELRKQLFGGTKK